MIVTLGCDNVKSNGCIESDAGIFGVLDEKLIRVMTGRVIPARANTACRCRLTAKCNIFCKHSVHRVISGGKVSDRQPDKRM